MQYYPTEQDRTYAPAPSINRVPLEERFPQKYAVNSLPTGKTANHQGKRKRGQGQNTLDRFVTRSGANLTPIGIRREEGELPDENDKYWEHASSESFDKLFGAAELNKENGWI
jgi:hypothetical protein